MNNTSLLNRFLIFVTVVAAAIAFLVPTVREATKQKGTELAAMNWISEPLSLGLDLSGGVHLVYRVDTDEAVLNRKQVVANSIRNSLRKEKIAVTKARVSNSGIVEISLLSERHIEAAQDLVAQEYDQLAAVTSTNKKLLKFDIKADKAQLIKTSAVNQSIETLRARVDGFGVAEPLIQKVGSERILLQMPGVQDIQAVKDIVGRVAKLEFRLLPVNPGDPDTISIKGKDGEPVKVEDSVQLTGDLVEDAGVSFDQNGQVEVSLTFNNEGAKTFSRLTGQNVERNLAIILDGVLYSAPNITEKISGGRCSISGGFTVEEARDLAVVLRAGALPAPLVVMEEKTVGPSLGAASIRQGITAILIGFVLILVFMVVYYKKAGLIAAVILALNILLVLAALSAFGATLTLPGLAGLALTIGMAVDANVISFERIREELRLGVQPEQAIDAGFAKALSAILDSNFTTLLAGFVLFYFGSGPIRGFAVTLSIGVITTIFCATFVVRLAFDYFNLKNKSGLSI